MGKSFMDWTEKKSNPLKRERTKTLPTITNKKKRRGKERERASVDDQSSRQD
jgi:hypothetical protein